MTIERIIVADSIFGLSEIRAVAVANGRIIGLLDDAGIRARKGLGVKVDEIRGVVLPGLTDAHSHPVLGAVLSRGLDLTGVSTLTDLRHLLREERSRVEGGEWIFGWGLAHSLWGGQDPHKSDIDDITEGVPCALRMFDVHSMLVNSVALERAGIVKGRSFDTGSRVCVDAVGAPTGYLVEVEAMALLDPVIPDEADHAVQLRLERILHQMSMAGLTGVHVMDANHNSAERYRAVEQNGELPLRLKVHPWVTPEMDDHTWREIADSAGEGGTRWSIHGVKLFLDGTIDNGTAWLRVPDRDGCSLRSAWEDPSRYRAALEFFTQHGIGTATHAIGDAAILHAASAIRDARAEGSGVRHRIEHLEMTGNDVIEAVRSSGAIASMQPTHCTHYVAADGSDNWSRRVGSRATEAWRLGSIWSSGVPIALGSDWPVAGFEPLPIIAAAQLRRPAGTNLPPVIPREGLPLAEAIAAYTRGPAYAAGVEDHEGRLAVGYRCDLTILDRDPTTVPPDELAGLQVNGTIVDGTVVYAR